MKVFTYNQYIKYIHKVRLNAVLQLAEEGAKYNTQSENKLNSKENLIFDILKDKSEVSKLINDFLEPKEIIKDEELAIYKNDYINKKQSSKECQVIYKIRNKPIFYLIKYKTNVDNQIEYKILNTCVDIIQAWSRNKKFGKSIEYPVIVPIVIYTGNVKWNVQKARKENQIGNYILERNNIELEYNLIDINRISSKFLIHKNSEFSRLMLMEKSKPCSNQ